ncbi:hypothetical protein RB195_021529 [Necator americanus]|uniref:Tetratricopeptide repeat protein n=1 Tax=Necator americanus TaxID=51031 RepID=A0ABR1EBH9_NECAM
MDSDCETALLMPKELEEKIYNYVENGTWPPATPPAPLPSVFEEFEPLDEEDPREDERVEASAEIDYVMDERIIARFADGDVEEARNIVTTCIYYRLNKSYGYRVGAFDSGTPRQKVFLRTIGDPVGGEHIFRVAALDPYIKGMRNADEASVACLELAKEGERFCREGNFTEAIPKFLKAISLGTNSLPTLSAIYCQLGNAYFSTNDMDNAYAYHAYDAVVARLMNDRLGEAKAYGNMGNVMKQKQKFNDALHITKKQLSIATELDDKPCLSRSYYNLGTIHHARAKLDVKKSKEESHPPREENRYIENEDLRTAMEYYMKSLKLAQSLNDHVNVGRLFGCIGNILYLLRDYRGAIDCHEKRLMIACQFGDHTAKYRAFINLGNAHVLLSEITKGIECYTSALNLAMEKGDRGREAQCCFYIGSASSLLRQYSSAANYHIRHLSLARSMGDSAGQARGFTSLATVYSNLEQYPKAAYFLACNRALAEQICDEIMLKHSEEALLKLFMENKSEFVVDNGLVQFDSAADPDPITHYCRIIEDPQPRVEFCDQRSSGFSSNTFPLTPTICVQNPSVRSVGVEARASRQCNDQQEDFFEFLSRMQSARLDEQRCDVTALKVNPLCLGRRQTDCFTTTSGR